MVIDDRIAERRAEVRDQRRRARLRRTLLVVTLVGLAAVLVAVERSALVALEEVAVEGVDRLEASEVREAADLELGTSILRLRLGQARERIEQLPLVRSAEARRADPLTVVVSVTEREPALTVTDGQVHRLVDRDGVVVLEGRLDGLPVIEVGEPPPPVGGSVAEHTALANAHRAWRGLSGPIRGEVVRYEAVGADELELELAAGIRVRFGRAQRLDEKVRALGAVLADIGDAEVEVIDVRAPSAPVVVGP